MTMTLTPDVIIIGAGPAGATLATLLAKAGRKALLVDRSEFPRDKICGDGLTPRAVSVIRRLKLDEDELKAAKVESALLVSPNGLKADLTFADLLELDAGYGYIVRRIDFDQWLFTKAIKAGAEFLQGSVQRVVRDQGRVFGVEVKTATGVQTIEAPLTIIAAGANVTLLKEMGVLSKVEDPIVAIRTYFDNVPACKPAFEFYFEKELIPGYGWVFPMADGRANVGVGVWSSALKGKRAPINTLLEQFLNAPRIKARLGEAVESGPRRSHPLRIDFPSHDIVGDGWMIIGEATGLVHPVTGEGIDLAMESGEIAAELILKRKPGTRWSKFALRPYERNMHRRFKTIFQGARMLQRMAMTEQRFDAIVRRAAHNPIFAKAALRINLGLSSPLATLSPAVLWSILGPKLRWMILKR